MKARKVIGVTHNYLSFPLSEPVPM